ncbi:hypothetical protein KKP06_22045 [Ralstonia pickettii]|uniref:hypothetical protein n=1 Tax=Ralstonia pickettii TaxID=329 RepID=UPI001BE40484|nr:hypothetical protein [Ralstonia pickettii]MBT2180501.1 hypothetical protein [Ralstonia pickettii]
MNFLEKLRAAADALIDRILSNNTVHTEMVAFANEAHAAIEALVQRVEALEGAAVHAAVELLPGLPLVNAPAPAAAADVAGAASQAQQ